MRQRPLPQHPYLAANGSSSMHNDAYASDAYAGGGPLGRDLQVSSATYGVEECATMSFDRQGRIVALCGGLEGSRLMLLDPDTLDVLAAHPLPPRKPSTETSPLEDLCGGAYFYLDERDRAIVETTNAQVWVLAESETPVGTPTFSLERTYDLSSAVPEGDCLIALMPDWDGRIWFVTQDGGVGTLDPAHRTRPQHPARRRADRELVRHRRDRRGLHRQRPRALPLRRRPPRQARSSPGASATTAARPRSRASCRRDPVRRPR